MASSDYWAHTPNDAGTPQTMLDHTARVADLAAEFAEPFGAQTLARWAAWLHDVGKYSLEFQSYLRECDAASKGNKKAPAAGSAEHKCAGTKLALENIAFPQAIRKALAACVLGHHGGIPHAGIEMMDDTIAKVEEETRGGEKMLNTAIQRAQKDCSQLSTPPPLVKNIPALTNLSSDQNQASLFWEMLTRFIFSCLVDADSLDTERHFSEDKNEQREVPQLVERLEEWRSTLHVKQTELMQKAKLSDVNHVRAEVYFACREAAKQPPGLFTLTVPTGGGKTRSVLAFALEHAAAHQSSEHNRRSRIIYAAPFTSIIDQTADVFRHILGQDAVLEHHSAVETRPRNEPEDGAESQTEAATERRQLLVQNWDVPLVVTTTVQLLESLFADRTTRCRKLHNFTNSIIILDEVQTLPPRLLTPLLSGLRALLDQFGVTLVLCTATQPAITGETPFRATLGDPTPIIEYPSEHFAKLKRVTYEVKEQGWDWTQTAKAIKDTETSCLVVLNTKKDAMALLDALREELPTGTHLCHLSTLMCGAHRRQVLDDIKARLEAAKHGGPPVVLASTQVIEAGVDVDFPNAFRALGPLDRIIQTAGRCNREKLRDKEESRVVVFTPLGGTTPGGEYRAGIATALNIIQAGGEKFDFDTPTVATEYFKSLYGSLGEDGLDKEKVQPERLRHNFPETAKKMRLIKDDTAPVIVPYHKGKCPAAELTADEFAEIVEEIRQIVAAQRAGFRKGKTLPRALWQKIQPLTVAIYRTELEKNKLPVSDLVPEQLYLWGAKYDCVCGVGGSDAVQLDISDLII